MTIDKWCQQQNCDYAFYPKSEHCKETNEIFSATLMGIAALLKFLVPYFYQKILVSYKLQHNLLYKLQKC